MSEVGRIIIGSVITILVGLIALLDKVRENRKKQDKSKYPVILFILLILGALISIDSSFDSYNKQLTSDTLAFINRKKADSLNNVLLDKQDIIYQLQKDLRDSTAMIVSLNKSMIVAQLENVNMIKGGGSFLECYIKPINEKVAEVTFVHHGKYPLSNISISILDHNALNGLEGKTIEEHQKASTVFYYPEVSPNTAVTFEKLQSDFTKDSLNYLVQYTARNGHFLQNIYLSKINGQWQGSTNVHTSGGKTLYKKFYKL